MPDKESSKPYTPMKRMPIIIAPKYTRATFMTSLAADHLYNWLRLRGFSPIKISGFRTRKPIVRKELFMSKFQPAPILIFYFGHGLDDSWIGMEDIRARFLKRRLIRLGCNEGWLDRDSIIYTISCYTLNHLGPELIKRGKVRTYFGSMEKMMINPIDNKIERRTVPDFVDVFTIGQKALAMGYTTGEALAFYYVRSDEIIKNYENSGELETSKQLMNAYKAMVVNREYFGAVGDLNTRWITQEQLMDLIGPVANREAAVTERVQK